MSASSLFDVLSRRRPSYVAAEQPLSPEQVLGTIYAAKYTGPLTFHFLDGVAKEVRKPDDTIWKID